jgi:uncharacterized OsmC-like protein
MSATIRDAWARLESVFTHKPAKALGTGVMRARITQGLRCECREGEWRGFADMPPEAGGEGKDPVPGVYGRAALASCLAIGISAALARAGVSCRSLEVEVEADYDNRGLLGMVGVNPGYSQVRHTVYIDSDAPQDALQAAVAHANRTSPYLSVFAQPQPMVSRVVLNARPA